MTSYLREYIGSDVRYADFVWISQASDTASVLTALFAGYISDSCKVNMKLLVIIGCILNVCSITVSYFTMKHSFGLLIGK